jgi:hypothetical protein
MTKGPMLPPRLHFRGGHPGVTYALRRRRDTLRALFRSAGVTLGYGVLFSLPPSAVALAYVLRT